MDVELNLRGARIRCASQCGRGAVLAATVRMAVALLLAVCWGGGPGGRALLACGPFFPNSLLSGNDAVLAAPEADFAAELERLGLLPKRSATEQGRQVGEESRSFAERTLAAELQDLRVSLAGFGVPPERVEAIVEAHRQERRKIVIDPRADGQLRPLPDDNPRIAQSMPVVVEGLPGEFGDYLMGSVGWHAGEMEEARIWWKKLLLRTAEERHYKSTWAAYMLGKSFEDEERKTAIKYFQYARVLAGEGFADTLKLGPASLGWEARLNVREKQYGEVIGLYLQQAAAGDEAVNSLRATASFALKDPEASLKKLARDPTAQKVITAYVISGGWRLGPIDLDGALTHAAINLLGKVPALAPRVNGWHNTQSPAVLWLNAVEAANVRDVASAEKLALAAYQAGQMDVAQRWIARAKTSPVAQWLQAKLHLRAGKLTEAAACLAQACRAFEQVPAATNGVLEGLEQSLSVEDYPEQITASRQAMGEAGVLHLVRRQYVEALDALLRAGFWQDASYVAERVLRTEELKDYVERNWGGSSERKPMSDQLRWLLARRLAREGRHDEALKYFPEEYRPSFARYAKALKNATNATLQNSERAHAYIESAVLARWAGMELLGTEGAPDGAIYGGTYPASLARASNLNLKQLAASADERQRAAAHGVEPDKRFHYRYVAAGLAWEAAKLMPDNDDKTAELLCGAGSWLKQTDPKAADVFYKALVRRCGKTALGAEADCRRWFPHVEEYGRESVR